MTYGCYIKTGAAGRQYVSIVVMRVAVVLTSLAVAAAGQEILVSHPVAAAGRDRRGRFLTCCAQSPTICGPHCAGAKCESSSGPECQMGSYLTATLHCRLQ